MKNPITVRIGADEYFALNDADWPVVASPSTQAQLEKTLITQSLVVRRHRDGRYLVYGLIKKGDEILVAAGMIVLPNSDLKVPLWRVAAENGLTEWHINECQRELANFKT